MKMKNKEITDYLCGPRDYREGVELYRRYGMNRMLMRTFDIDDSQTTRLMLLEELRKIAGLSETEFARLPRLARARKYVEAPQETAEASEERRKPMPVPTVPGLRLRERYPFLKEPSCPDILKVLVADMLTAYGKFKDGHSYLVAFPDEPTELCAEKCREIVECYLEDREILAELEYYKEHGEILGRAKKFRLKAEEESMEALSDMELMKKLQSAKVNVSKQKKRLADCRASGKDTEQAEAALAMWEDKKTLFEAEAESRKKK